MWNRTVASDKIVSLLTSAFLCALCGEFSSFRILCVPQPLRPSASSAVKLFPSVAFCGPNPPRSSASSAVKTLYVLFSENSCSGSLICGRHHLRILDAHSAGDLVA